MRICIVGAGWAGLAAGVLAVRDGHQVSVFEASRAVGGRARALPALLPDGRALTLDNGQHILIGAYSQTLALMRSLGIEPDAVLLRLPLTLRFQDGSGLVLPDWTSPWNVLAGISLARGWSLADKWSLGRAALAWRRAGFACAAATSVADLCHGLCPRVRAELIEPLCISALNTPVARASGQVFLRVLRDALFGAPGGSDLLLPRVDLSALFPCAAAQAITQAGGQVLPATRVLQLRPGGAARWLVNNQPFDTVLLACGALDASGLLEQCAAHASAPLAQQLRGWSRVARGLQFEGIATVYAWAPGARLAEPMLALHSGADAPAQFVFDRGQLGGEPGLLAFVVSASQGERALLQSQVLAQARVQLGLELQPVQTVMERRATFSCTAALQRPAQPIARGLLACADYVQGPYPATLEGALRSALGAQARAWE